ncbi:DNA mismatch repair protein MSH7-like [Chenopodium quinoa]|uniref:DNA mismatch repair protein MSH7-like n=1 Tax=Chenopodium quinoa TaxID=63459 RepID=UPI000B796908|nr:DNA mismatch repair protein MSH7-like [Chenopodium quinoa]
MQRQRSILSFFQKPSPENRSSTAGDKVNAAGNRYNLPSQSSFNGGPNKPSSTSSKSSISRLEEIRGTDTPPEKVPRQVQFDNLTPTDNKKSSVFSSILHKFSKVDPIDRNSQRNQDNGGSSVVCSMFDMFNECNKVPKESGSCKVPENNSNGSLNKDYSVKSNCDFINLEPETPLGRPFVPRLKRIQEDCSNFGNKSDFNLTNSSKRVKFAEDSKPVNKSPQEVIEVASKFEWLHPSKIRDANGRRPSDPIYDKRTLYIPPDVLKKMSASQKQYWSVKCQYMDVLLFFKVGKFYELYELDADIGHKELDWKLTNSGVGKCRQVGISENGIDDAVQKLVARGYKVGRIEQLETSDQVKARGANAVIPRKLVNVITPSTAAGETIGPDAVHLLAIKEGSCGVDGGTSVYGFAFVDCAALKIWIGSVSDDASCAALMALLMQVSPKEIIYESRGLSREAQKVLKKYSSTGSMGVQITPMLPVNGFLEAAEVKAVIQTKKYFKNSGNLWDHLLDGVTNHEFTLRALGGLIDHLSRLMLDDVLCYGDVLPYQVYRGCLRMDGQTLINLEVFQNNADGGSVGTLFKYLDNCITPSGKRLLRSWICHPLKDIDEINNRLNVVEALIMRSEIMLIIAQYLRKIPDLERLLGKVKAMVHSQAILTLPLVGKKTLKQRVKVFGLIVKGLRIGMDLMNVLYNEEHLMSLLSKILDLPPLSEHNALSEFLSQFEAAIDSDFPKYQDHDVTEADAEILSILIELFVEKASQWSQVIFALCCIDVLRSFATIAIDSSGSMCRPSILPQSTSTVCQNNEGPTLKFKGLWHPFALRESGGLPVPNDIVLGKDTNGHLPRTLLLTGPNMGGKSTLLRAACLAVILAQLGCYVPCETCSLSVADIIFTRLGATDRIMTGESTFYIECAETASVLQNATQDSLVLLDELGRGTSTFDGYAIAYAVFRHLIEKVNCRLLFATHYHPLTKEFASHPHVSLQHMSCAMKPRSSTGEDFDLVFVYRLATGACPSSYGLQVALMAGIPKQVVESASTAGEVMKEMIGNSFKSSEQRSEFSTIHEQWLKTILSLACCEDSNFDDDTYDTLFCLWHELKTSYKNSTAPL